MALFHVKRVHVHVTDQEAESFVACGQALLRSYAALSHQARARSLRLWPLRPKLHQLAHLLRGVQQTHVRPGWAFADEDFNQLVMRSFRGAPNVANLGERTALAARYRLWRPVQ